MAQEQKGPFSNFTVNRNTGGANAPTLKGRLTVIDVDGKPVELEWAGWGPNAAKDQGREYFSIQVTPADPALAARQTQIQNGKLEMPPVPNAPTGLTLDRLGRGVLFETNEQERAAAEAAGKKVRTFFGSALVLLPSGPRAIDLAARKVDGYAFHSGWANHHDPDAAAKARADKAAGAQPQEPSPRRRGKAAEAGNG